MLHWIMSAVLKIAMKFQLKDFKLHIILCSNFFFLVKEIFDIMWNKIVIDAKFWFKKIYQTKLVLPDIKLKKKTIGSIRRKEEISDFDIFKVFLLPFYLFQLIIEWKLIKYLKINILKLIINIIGISLKKIERVDFVAIWFQNQMFFL